MMNALRLDAGTREYHNAGDDSTETGVGQVMIAPVDRRDGNQARYHEQSSIYLFALWHREPQAEGSRESCCHVRAGEDTGVDPVVAEHPQVEAPEDRVVRRKVQPGKHYSRRLRRPEGELRIAKQNA